MTDWVVTFGQRFARERHSVLGAWVHPDGWLSVVGAPDDEQAVRQRLFRFIGTEWAFLYRAEAQNGSLFRRGELAVLDYPTGKLTVHPYDQQLELIPGHTLQLKPRSESETLAGSS